MPASMEVVDSTIVNVQPDERELLAGLSVQRNQTGRGESSVQRDESMSDSLVVYQPRRLDYVSAVPEREVEAADDDSTGPMEAVVYSPPASQLQLRGSDDRVVEARLEISVPFVGDMVDLLHAWARASGRLRQLSSGMQGFEVQFEVPRERMISRSGEVQETWVIDVQLRLPASQEVSTVPWIRQWMSRSGGGYSMTQSLLNWELQGGGYMLTMEDYSRTTPRQRQSLILRNLRMVMTVFNGVVQFQGVCRGVAWRRSMECVVLTWDRASRIRAARRIQAWYRRSNERVREEVRMGYSVVESYVLSRQHYVGCVPHPRCVRCQDTYTGIEALLTATVAERNEFVLSVPHSQQLPRHVPCEKCVPFSTGVEILYDATMSVEDDEVGAEEYKSVESELSNMSLHQPMRTMVAAFPGLGSRSPEERRSNHNTLISKIKLPMYQNSLASGDPYDFMDKFERLGEALGLDATQLFVAVPLYLTGTVGEE